MTIPSTIASKPILFDRFKVVAANIANHIQEVAEKVFAWIHAYDYRCSALYASSFPLAVPITIVGICQALKGLACKVPHGQHAKMNRALALTDLLNGISGLLRTFSVSVVALTYFTKIEPLVQAISGPLSVAASVGNLFYGASIIFRALMSIKKVKQMGQELSDNPEKTAFHVLAENKLWSRKELAYDFQTNGKKIRATFNDVAKKLEDEPNKVQEITQLLHTRINQKRISDALAIVIAVASIISSICFFVMAGTVLAPAAWLIAFAVLGISAAKYICDLKSINDFQYNLDEFLKAPPSQVAFTDQLALNP